MDLIKIIPDTKDILSEEEKKTLCYHNNKI